MVTSGCTPRRPASSINRVAAFMSGGLCETQAFITVDTAAAWRAQRCAVVSSFAHGGGGVALRKSNSGRVLAGNEA